MIELSNGLALSGLRRLAALAGSGAVVVVLALLPAGASANSVICGGTAKRAPDTTDRNQVEYSFHCTESLKSYTIAASAPLDSFGADTSITPLAPGGATGKLFSCEGSIPSMGFGCNSGDLPAGAFVSATLSPSRNICAAPTNRFRLFVIGVDTNGNSSEPFALRVARCQTTKRSRRHRRHGA